MIMKKLDKKEKKSLLHKLLEFKRTGLIAYSKYLAKQLEQSEGVKERKAYNRYIKKELVSTAKKIARMDAKLAKYTDKLAKAAKKAKLAKPESTLKTTAAKPAATAVAKHVKKVAVKPAAQPTEAREPRAAAAAGKSVAKVAPKAPVANKKPSTSS
jgi:hypothetical protein